MSEKEYKIKCENLFKKNTILLNQQKADAERISELEAQIEKMKLCANCKHYGISGWCNKLNEYLDVNQCCGNWEIREIKEK